MPENHFRLERVPDVYWNRSAGDVADVPFGVTTVMSINPATWAGLTIVMTVSLTTTRLVPAVVPNLTDVAPVKPEPDSLTDVPPAVAPRVMLSPVTTRGETDEVYVNRSADDVTDVPFGVVTVTFTVPVSAGLTIVMAVSLATTRLVPAAAPKFTAVAPVKPEPVSVAAVPPAMGPLLGLMAVTTGGTAG